MLQSAVSNSNPSYQLSTFILKLFISLLPFMLCFMLFFFFGSQICSQIFGGNSFPFGVTANSGFLEGKNTLNISSSSTCDHICIHFTEMRTELSFRTFSSEKLRELSHQHFMVIHLSSSQYTNVYTTLKVLSCDLSWPAAENHIAVLSLPQQVGENGGENKKNVKLVG